MLPNLLGNMLCIMKSWDWRGAIMNNNESRVIVVTGAAKLDGIGAKTCQVF